MKSIIEYYTENEMLNQLYCFCKTGKTDDEATKEGKHYLSFELSKLEYIIKYNATKAKKILNDKYIVARVSNGTYCYLPKDVKAFVEDYIKALWSKIMNHETK